MNKLFKHIKSHKGWYGLGVVVLLLVGVLAYTRAPGELGEELAGRLDRVLRKPVIRKEVQVTKPTKKLACTEADWSCTAFEPAECPPSGERTRTCTLTNRQCTNPNAVKPAETESCTPAKTLLTVSKDPSMSTTLTNAENVLLSIVLKAGDAGDVEMNGMNFEIGGDVTPMNYKLYREATFMMTSDTSSFVFGVPEIISAGATKRYILKANVIGAIVNSAVKTTLQNNGIVTDVAVEGLFPISHTLIY